MSEQQAENAQAVVPNGTEPPSATQKIESLTRVHLNVLAVKSRLDEMRTKAEEHREKNPKTALLERRLIKLVQGFSSSELMMRSLLANIVSPTAYRSIAQVNDQVCSLFLRLAENWCITQLLARSEQIKTPGELQDFEEDCMDLHEEIGRAMCFLTSHMATSYVMAFAPPQTADA